jgi:hypothetical protein
MGRFAPIPLRMIRALPVLVRLRTRRYHASMVQLIVGIVLGLGLVGSVPPARLVSSRPMGLG